MTGTSNFELPPEIQEMLQANAQKYLENNRKHRIADFVTLNRFAEKNAIVLLGDSIIEGFPIQEMFRVTIPIYNRGIGGDTTTNVLERLEESIYDLQPSRIFLQIGTNDFEVEERHAVSEIAGRIEQICKQIQTNLPTAQLYLLSVFPVNAAVYYNSMDISSLPWVKNNELIQSLNVMLRHIADQLSLPYVNIYPHLTDTEGNLRSDYTKDGLHLNVEGYYVVLSQLEECFD
jgi:lysophospholipase L1-like esterase